MIEGYFKIKGKALGEHRIIRPFHKRIFRALDQWFAGLLPDSKKNLAVCIPPRHTKTTLARDIVECGLAVAPDSEWIYTSYSATLAVDQTVKIKETLNSEWYLRFTGGLVGMVDGRQDYFRTKAGGCVYGVGALGAITGFGAGKKRPEFGGAIIIDDPLKASDANSPTVREKVNQWFTGTLLSRRNAGNGTPMLLIAQRLHPHDLVGYLKETSADEWYFLEIPALPDGEEETIWPETFDRKAAEWLRETEPSTFYAQYQQTPIPPGGGMIKDEWWVYWDDEMTRDEVEARIDIKIITADTAYSTKESADYSVFQCWGFEGSQRVYLLDQVRGRWSYEHLLAVACEFWEKHSVGDSAGYVQPVYRMYIENKASGQSLVQQYDLFREREINCLPWDGGQRDKVSRVRECLASIAAGRVQLPRNEPWMDSFMAECSAMSEDGSQVHDDQVDAMTMAILIWRGQMGGRSE